MPFTEYLKRRALVFHSMGLSPAAIAKALSNEGLVATRQGIKKFLDRYEETGTLERRPGSGRPSRITQAVRAIVEEQMRSDDETTAVQLAALLNRRGYRFALMTILRCRQTLGWTFRGSSYCQMIRDANKLKRLEWSRQYIHEAEAGFLDVVYTDETSIQMESHRRFCCRKRGEPPRNKPRVGWNQSQREDISVCF